MTSPLPFQRLQIIQKIVAEHYGVDWQKIISKDRHRRYVTPRHVAMYLAKAITKKSLMELGHAFRRDHSVILYAIWKIEKLVRDKPAFYSELNDLRLKIEARLHPPSLPVSSSETPTPVPMPPSSSLCG